VKNLAHSAAFHSSVKVAPPKPGIKHLASHSATSSAHCIPQTGSLTQPRAGLAHDGTAQDVLRSLANPLSPVRLFEPKEALVSNVIVKSPMQYLDKATGTMRELRAALRAGW
jgi:hypothetical protein